MVHRMMRLGEIEILEPYPAAYIPSVDSVVIAELHLGYESAMAGQGVFLPRVQLKKELEMLRGMCGKQRASRIVVNGDFKHEFTRGSYRENAEVEEMLDFLTGRFDEVLLIKGNHDNFLTYPARRHGAEVVEHLELGDYSFHHGHKVPKKLGTRENLVIAHEHPAVAFYDEVGAKEKMPCFLYGGTLNQRNLLVLPAFAPLSLGSEVNTLPKEELLSPLLRNMVDVDGLRVIGIREDVGALRLPRLGDLRFF